MQKMDDSDLLKTLLGSFDIELANCHPRDASSIDLDDDELNFDSDFEIDWADDEASSNPNNNSNSSSPTKRAKIVADDEPRSDDLFSVLTSKPVPHQLLRIVYGTTEQPRVPLAFCQELLLIVWHSHRCTRQLGDCLLQPESCNAINKLFRHACDCRDASGCEYARHGCAFLKDLIAHYKACTKRDCALCHPVRTAVNAVTKKNKNDRREPAK